MRERVVARSQMRVNEVDVDDFAIPSVHSAFAGLRIAISDLLSTDLSLDGEVVAVVVVAVGRLPRAPKTSQIQRT